MMSSINPIQKRSSQWLLPLSDMQPPIGIPIALAVPLKAVKSQKVVSLGLLSGVRRLLALLYTSLCHMPTPVKHRNRGYRDVVPQISKARTLHLAVYSEMVARLVVTRLNGTLAVRPDETWQS